MVQKRDAAGIRRYDAPADGFEPRAETRRWLREKGVVYGAEVRAE